MNIRNRRVRAQFAPEIRFEVTPPPTVPFRGAQETELERLKQRLLRQLLDETSTPEVNLALCRAAGEAAALVWLTAYPLLLLPALFEEKARAVRLQAWRQERIRQRSKALLPAEAV